MSPDLPQWLSESGLIVQPSDEQIICTACSLVNALILSGIRVSDETSQQLIDSVLETGEPIDWRTAKKFVQQYGHELEFIRIPNGIGSYDDAINLFLNQLGNGTGIVSISTLLSKRDRSMDSLVDNQLSEILHDRQVLHVTSVVRDNDNVYIIDPYDSNNPEVFDITQEEDRLELASWLVSSYFQKAYSDENPYTNSEILLSNIRNFLLENDWLDYELLLHDARIRFIE